MFAGTRLEGAVAIGLALLLFVATLAIGSVHVGASAAVGIAVAALAAASFAAGRRGGVPRSFVLCAGALVAYLVFQLVPLPPGVVAVLSPETREIHRRGIEAVGETVTTQPARAADDPGEAPTAAEAERTHFLTPAERQSVRELARSVRYAAWAPDGWRPLALDPWAGGVDLVRYVSYGLVLWMAATLPAPGFLLRVLVATGASMAVLALLQVVIWNGNVVLWAFNPYGRWLPPQQRLSGPFVNPDHFAMFLAMLIPAAAGLLAATWSRERRPREGDEVPWSGVLPAAALLVALGLMIAALIGSASRGGLTGAMIGGVVFWWGLASRPARRRHEGHNGGRHASERPRRARPEPRLAGLRRLGRRAAPSAAAIAIVAIGLGYAGKEARDTLDARLARTVERPDLGSRDDLIVQSLPMVADFPLTGIGTGAWAVTFPRYARGDFAGITHNNLHDDYLEWLIEVGVAGAFLTVLVALAWGRGVWSNRDAIPVRVRWGMMGAVVAVGWHEIFDFGLRIPAVALVLATILGLLLNPHWRARRLAAGQRGGFQTAGALVLAAGLAFLSARQLLESIQWQRVWEGWPELSFAARNPGTWLEFGRLLERVGNGKEPPAGDVYHAALRLRPVSADAAFGIARASGEDVTTRERALAAALFLDPAHTASRLARADMLDWLGRPEEALREWEEAAYRDMRLARHPHIDAERDFTGERLAAVKRGFHRAVEENPRDVARLVAVANFHQARKEDREAAPLWARAAETSGDWAGYGLRAAQSWAKAGELERAEEIVTRVLGERPDGAAAYRLLAVSIFAPQGRYDEAEEVLERGLVRTRERAVLYTALADLRRAAGDTKGAVEALSKAAEWSGGDARTHLRLADAHLAAGNLDRAKLAFERAIELDPARASLHFRKGRVLERLYDLAGAAAAYHRATALDPANKTYRTAVERLEEAFEDGRS